MNFGGVAYAFTDGDISFDPVLRIEEGVMELHTFPVQYIRSFEMLGKSARFDLVQAYQDARWSGLLDGEPRTVSRHGLSDTVLRLAVNLVGAPPLSGEEFATYRAAVENEWIVGTALVVHLPTGHYLEDKLLNLGSNRYTFRPQLGVVRKSGQWSAELTMSSWFYTHNSKFFGARRLETDPLLTAQGHVDYTFRPGLWVSAGVGYAIGARSTLDRIPKEDKRENLGWIVSFGYPIRRQWGIKIAYTGIRTQRLIGSSTDTLILATSVTW